MFKLTFNDGTEQIFKTPNLHFNVDYISFTPTNMTTTIHVSTKYFKSINVINVIDNIDIINK